MTIKLKAYAKLNLLLDITGIMPNGYHYLSNVTQSVDVADILTVTAEKSDKFSCAIGCDNPDIPTDEGNIVYKAAKKFSDKAGFYISCDIDIEKHVPLMGGMGGSSVDGAGTLYALNSIFDNILSEKEILAIGEEIGADVPLCYIGGTIYSYSTENISRIEKISARTDAIFLCIQPDFSCSTGTAYRMYDENPTIPYNKTKLFVGKIQEKGTIYASKEMYNIFTVLYNDNRIDNIKAELVKHGAIASEMTGSGSVVFGIFDSSEKAEKAKSELSFKYKTIFTCKPTESGIMTL